MKIVVIGGGLAGLTAAIALSEPGSGNEVTLLEAKPRAGGATMSFARDGLTVDTGQHVFLRCCTAYRGLLDRLGVAGHAPLQDRFDVTVLRPGDRSARLRRTRMPGPLQMLPALARYPFLSLAERAVVSRAALAFRRVDVASPAADNIRLGDWLAARGQSERARRVLWDLFTVSSLNLDGDEASLALSAYVVQQALLGKVGAADIGVPELPLGELHGEAALRLLASQGAEVRLGAKAVAIEVGATETGAPGTRPRFLVRVPDDVDGIDADGIVLAVPHEAAARLIPDGALPRSTVTGWAGLGAAPIVNVHVIYDRQVLTRPFAAAVDSPVQWVFDRTKISGCSSAGQYLAISLSAADPYVDVPAAKLREQFVPALAELLPAAGEAKITEFFVTRERRATFRQGPGCGQLRPAAGTALPGLVLAGSWTDTGWPDTMESAVRSGLAAATVLRAAASGAGAASSAAASSGAAQESSASGEAASSGVAAPADAVTSVTSAPSDAANSSAARGTNPASSGFVVNGPCGSSGSTLDSDSDSVRGVRS